MVGIRVLAVIFLQYCLLNCYEKVLKEKILVYCGGDYLKTFCVCLLLCLHPAIYDAFPFKRMERALPPTLPSCPPFLPHFIQEIATKCQCWVGSKSLLRFPLLYAAAPLSPSSTGYSL